MSVKKKTIIALTIILLIVLGSVGAILFKNSQVETLSTRAPGETLNGTNSTSGTIVDDVLDVPTLAPEVELDGVNYILKDNVTTFLFFGVDRAKGSGTNGFASYILMFVLDNDEKTINIIKVPSDWATGINIYDDDHYLLETVNAALGDQYSYGDSDARSCFITKPVVIRALGGPEVNYQFAITMDGLLQVVNSLGSVDVVLRNDWTDIDSSYEVDSTVTLNSSDVREFFDAIGIGGEGSIEAGSSDNSQTALSREDWFMLSLFRAIMSAGSSDVDKLMEAADGAYETDVSADMIDQFRNYEMRGSMVASKDSKELQKQIVSLFYKEA